MPSINHTQAVPFRRIGPVLAMVVFWLVESVILSPVACVFVPLFSIISKFDTFSLLCSDKS